MPNEKVVAEKHNPAIPTDTVTQIALWMDATLVDVVDRLRPRTVPPGFIYTCVCCTFY